MSASALQNVPLDVIVNDPQIRTRNGFEPESIRELAESIKSNGLLQPLLIRPNPHVPETYIVVAGHRRLMALRWLRAFEAPCLITSHDSADAALPSQLVENLQRVDLCLADLVQGVREVAEALSTPERVGKALGKSKAWVSKHLAVTGPKFNARASELVTAGLVTDLEVAHAYNQIANAKGDETKRAAALQDFEYQLSLDMLTRASALAILAAFKEKPKGSDDDDAGEGEGDGAGEGEGDGAGDAEPKQKTTIKLTTEQYALFEEKGGKDWLINLLVS